MVCEYSLAGLTFSSLLAVWTDHVNKMHNPNLSSSKQVGQLPRNVFSQWKFQT